MTPLSRQANREILRQWNSIPGPRPSLESYRHSWQRHYAAAYAELQSLWPMGEVPFEAYSGASLLLVEEEADLRRPARWDVDAEHD